MTWVRVRPGGSIALAGDMQDHLRAGDGVAPMWPNHYRPVWRDGYPRIAGRSAVTGAPFLGLGSLGEVVDTTVIVRQVLAKFNMSGAQLEAAVNQAMDRYGADMHKQAVDRAAVAAGLTVVEIVLVYIPVVGAVAAAVLAVVQVGLQIVQDHYKNEANAIIARTQQELQLAAAQYQAKIDAEKTAAVQQESVAAAAMAVSGMSLNGLDGFGLGNVWDNVARDMRRAVEATTLALKPVRQVTHNAIQLTNKIVAQVPIPAVRNAALKLNELEGHLYDNMDETERRYDEFIKLGTGEAQLAKAQEAASRAKAQGLAEMQRQYEVISANLRSATFRDQLRKTLATYLRTNPSIMQIAGSGMSIPGALPPEPLITLTTQEPSKALTAVPMAASAVGAAALLFLLNK